METAAPTSRTIDLPVVPNARHLGGLPAPAGPAALHDVIRSGTLAGFQPAALDVLHATGVGIIVDLRTDDERALSPEPELGARGLKQLWLPVVERDPAPLGVNLEYGHAGFLWMYQNFLEYGRPAIVQLLNVLVDYECGVLYHCAAGQDRTGLITAVLLSLAGVEESAIIEDHSLSVRADSLAARGIAGAAASQRITAPQHGMRALLQIIRDRWGDAEGYILDAGASPAAVSQFRARVSR